MTVLHDAPEESVAGERARRAERRRRVETQRATRSPAAQRALDRRRKRLDSRVGDAAPVRATRSARKQPSVSLWERLRRMPFVVPVIVLLVAGLGLSLWLSTKATQDSYRIGVQRKENQALEDRLDSLTRTYESGNSAPELAEKAARLGMIPAKDPARMIVDPHRKPRIAGTPQPATGTPMPDLNPSATPDPTAKIDPKTVDDSIGLGGSGVAAPSQTAAPPSTQTPSGTAAPSSPPGSPVPTQTPAPTGTSGPDGAATQTPTAPVPAR